MNMKVITSPLNFFYMQVELRLGKSVLIVTRSDLLQIPYLHLLTSERWCFDGSVKGFRYGVYNIPSCIELQDDATLLPDLVGFTLIPEQYKIPDDWKRLFKLVRCADFLSMDNYLLYIADVLHVEATTINNANPVHRVRWLLRSKYRSAAHHAKKYGQKCCRLCYAPLGRDAPHYSNMLVMPCCQNEVHTECWKGGESCRLCSTSFNLLACALCKENIDDWGEVGYWSNMWMLLLTSSHVVSTICTTSASLTY